MPCLIALFVFVALTAPVALRPAGAIELEQLAEAAHAYPVMLDPSGKTLGTGEFSQQIEDGLLRIEITYKLKNGVRIQEKAAFQQRPELIQKEWSWRERKGDELQREFTVDFDSARASAQKREEDGLKNWSEAVEIEPGAPLRDSVLSWRCRTCATGWSGRAERAQSCRLHPKPRVVTVKLSYHGRERMRMSGRELRGEHFLIQPQIPAVAQLFVKISDTHIWPTPPPAGFLRWGALWLNRATPSFASISLPGAKAVPPGRSRRTMLPNRDPNKKNAETTFAVSAHAWVTSSYIG